MGGRGLRRLEGFEQTPTRLIQKNNFYTLKLSLNPFTAMGNLIDFTLSNARQFYSSKGKNLTVKGLKRRWIGCWDKHRDFWTVENKLNGDQIRFGTENKAYVCYACITLTKRNGWKSSMLIPQNVLRKTNPENFSSIGPITLKRSFVKGDNNSIWENKL